MFVVETSSAEFDIDADKVEIEGSGHLRCLKDGALVGLFAAGVWGSAVKADPDELRK